MALALREYLDYYARTGIDAINYRLEKIRPYVLAIKQFYCDLLKLEKADAFDLNEYMTLEQRELIEGLIELFGLKCEDTPF